MVGSVIGGVSDTTLDAVSVAPETRRGMVVVVVFASVINDVRRDITPSDGFVSTTPDVRRDIVPPSTGLTSTVALEVRRDMVVPVFVISEGLGMG